MTVRVAAVVAICLATPQTVRAEFLTALTGNTRMSDTATADGIVNFTVYRTVDANWTNDAAFAGTGPRVLLAGSAVDANTRFVFLWQIVNDNPSGGGNPTLTILRAPIGLGAAFSSIGVFNNTLFQDAAGQVGPVGNQRLGVRPGSADPGVQDGDDTIDGVPSENNVAAPTFSILAAALEPTAATLNDGTGTARVTWGAALGNNSYSAVVFATSDSPLMPIYGAGFIGRVAFANGDVPAPIATPEPASLVPFAFGLVWFAVHRVKGRRAAGLLQTGPRSDGSQPHRGDCESDTCLDAIATQPAFRQTTVTVSGP